MSSEKVNFSIADLLALPGGELAVRWSQVKCNQSLHDVVAVSIDDVFKIISRDLKKYQGMTEDEFTALIIAMLVAQKIDAVDDPMRGGHVDILIKFGSLEWLGEAKLFETDQNSGLAKGMKQLLDRYVNQYITHGGLLIYTYKGNATQILNNWNNYAEQRNIIEGATCAGCKIAPKLAFESKHIGPQSGLEVTIRHSILSLYFSPTDAGKS